MKLKRNLLIVICTLVFIGGGAMLWFVVNQAIPNNQSQKPKYRQLNAAERQQLMDTVSGIITKYGTFKLTYTTEPLPDDGVVYSIKKIRKDTQVVFDNGHRYDRVPDGTKF
ncbi:hypothetical protein J23TS9_18220 [Paenibacillus sp. J23TS9]|uniref:hypothetical protein n=1 Tax=Paenibacillus sp. J23TS9 TaxID=2807193 RepID=UPI001B06ADA6|nr:hypothetical protein [Paenibacillus sp. J23TS9]GIP26692.1 hypothetical protein J23TS9_18220 [Paenibacillus sp. J23TS9]